MTSINRTTGTPAPGSRARGGSPAPGAVALPTTGWVLGEPAATLNEIRAAAEEPAHAYA